MMLCGALTASATPRADILSLMEQVDTAHLDQTIFDMVAYGTRYAGSANTLAIAEDLKERFEDYGWQTELQEFTFDPDTLDLDPITSWNIIAHRGGWNPDALIVLGGHWDSIDQFPGGSYDDPQAPSPGANDNGSGIASVLEIARVLGQSSFRQDVEIVLFGAEETKLQGSKHYVDELLENEVNVGGYFNIDSVSYDVEDIFDLALYHDNQSAWFMAITKMWIEDYSTEVVPIPYYATNGGANSDVHWFWYYSIPAVSIWEGPDHAPYYNHRLDTYDNCNSQNGFHETVTSAALACFCIWSNIVNDTAVDLQPQAGTGDLSVYPNPFRHGTSIHYGAAADSDRAGSVQVFDISGRLQRTLALGGDSSVIWDGNNERGIALPAGVYMLRATGDSEAAGERVVLIR